MRGSRQQGAATHTVPAEVACALCLCGLTHSSPPVLQLLQANRAVVAAVRDPAKAEDLFQDASGSVAVEAADVTDPSTFSDSLWQGVSQVVSAVGPTFQRTEEGPKCAPHAAYVCGRSWDPPCSAECVAWTLPLPACASSRAGAAQRTGQGSACAGCACCASLAVEELHLPAAAAASGPGVHTLARHQTPDSGACRPGTTSEDVDAKGVANIAKAWAARQDSAARGAQRTEMVTMRSSKDLDRWLPCLLHWHCSAARPQPRLVTPGSTCRWQGRQKA